MKISSKIILIAVAAVLGAWLWFVFFPGPEKIIRHRLAKLARDVSFSKSEGNISRVASAERVSGFFSTNAEVIVTIPGYEHQTLVGRAEITQVALASRTQVRELKVKFPDVTVSIAPDKKSATADVTVEVNVAGNKDPIVQEAKITLEKTAEGWLIKRIEPISPVS